MYWSCSNAENRRLFETNIIEIDLFCLIMRRPWLQTIQTILYNTHKFIHINYDQNDQSKKIWRKQTMLYACSNFFSLLLAEYICWQCCWSCCSYQICFSCAFDVWGSLYKKKKQKRTKKKFFSVKTIEFKFLELFTKPAHTNTFK